MKKYFICFAALLLASVFAALSCTQIDPENAAPEENGPADQSKLVTITAYLPEDNPQSKISITEADDYSYAALTWQSVDKLTVIGESTKIFSIDQIMDGGKKATFTGGDPGGSSFTILYHPSNPADTDGFDAISYDGQVQNGNGSTAHLKYAMKLSNVDAYSPLSFTGAWAAEHCGELTQNSVLQLILKLPDGVGEVYSIYVKDGGTFQQTLWLTDDANIFATPNDKHVIKGYMMVPDMSLTSPITVRVETEDGAYEADYALTVTNWTGGSQYTVQKNMSNLSAVTGEHAKMEIHAKSAQDILQFRAGVNASNDRFKASNVILEDNIDMTGVNWNTSISGFTGSFGSSSQNNIKTISGISATEPLFSAIPSGATLKNLILDGSFNLAQAESGNDYLGSLAKQLQGSLSNVTVNASIALVGNSRSSLLDFGGLIGRANNASASITGCSFNGNIGVPSTYSNSNANGLRLGGLVGYVTQALTISESSFGGIIRCEGGLSANPTDPSDASNHPVLSVGGIVGKLQKGTISGCSTSDALEKLKPSIVVDATTYKGSIFIKSTTYNSASIGGIAGFCYDGSATITGCTNNTTILTNISIADAENVYVFSGGVVGLNRLNVTDCQNNGAQYHFSTSKLQSIGGVIGRNYGSLNVNTKVENDADIFVYSAPTSNKYQYAIGGVIGYNTASIECGSSAFVKNTGDINQSFNGLKIETTASATNELGVFLGGIAGFSTDGITYASNDGDIEFVCNHIGSDTEVGGANFVHIGGIVGKVNASSLVDLSFSNNSGDLTFNPTTTAPHSTGSAATKALYDHNYLGGIVGYAYLTKIIGDATNLTSNSGSVLGGDNSGNNNTAETFWVGGIVGRLEGASSSISYCELSGSGIAKNNHWSNKSYSSYAPMCGGIAGEVLGNSTSYASVSHCSIANTANVIAVRGDMGGIVGYARYSNISNCNVSRNFSGQSGYLYGGIVGWLRQGSVTSCTFSGSQIRSSQMQYGGGIVGYLHTNATVDNCSSYASDISKNGTAVTGSGAIAGLSVSGAIIKNTHRKSSMNICGDSNFTDGENNVADLDL